MKNLSFSAFLVLPSVLFTLVNVQSITAALVKNTNIGSTVPEVSIPRRQILSQTTSPTTYYVSSSGSDDNDGLSVQSPFRRIQKAANLTNPGDTVMIMNGVYTNENTWAVVHISRSGTANSWIKYQAYPGHTPKIKHNAWDGIIITERASYIEVKGLEVEGNNGKITLDYALSQQYIENPLTNGNCISIDEKSHHIRILNNKTHNCGGAGIRTFRADYVTISGNEVYNNAWYGIHGNSGIVLYQNWNSDTNHQGDQWGYKMYVTNNRVYNNRQYISWIASGKIQDGNGIIVDDARNTQINSTLGAYRGKVLIANNLSYQNGASGILTFKSDNVNIINNTLYMNSQSPEITKGQLGADSSSNVNIFNNIVYSYPGKKINTAFESTNVIFKNNMYFNSPRIWPVVASDIVADPKFVNASNGDFRLQSTSPAINAGIPFMKNDFADDLRPSGAGYDIGAYEYQF